MFYLLLEMVVYLSASKSEAISVGNAFPLDLRFSIDAKSVCAKDAKINCSCLLLAKEVKPEARLVNFSE